MTFNIMSDLGYRNNNNHHHHHMPQESTGINTHSDSPKCFVFEECKLFSELPWWQIVEHERYFSRGMSCRGMSHGHVSHPIVGRTEKTKTKQ